MLVCDTQIFQNRRWLGNENLYKRHENIVFFFTGESNVSMFRI